MTLLEKIENYLVEKPTDFKIMKAKLFSSFDEKDYEELYTIKNSKGEFALSKDGSVFWGKKKDIEKMTEKDIDGKPYCKKPKNKMEIVVMEYNNVFGLYDGNMKLIQKYSSMDDMYDDFKEDLEDSGKIRFNISNLDFDLDELKD